MRGKDKTAAASKVVARDYESGAVPIKTPGTSKYLCVKWCSGQVGSCSTGKSSNKGSTTQTAISVPSEGEDDDEEDDFEEVPIPGPSSGPNTPGSSVRPRTDVDTPGTNTPAPSVDDDFEGYGDEEDEEDDGKKDDIIRVEFGGENEEEKARRIALAMRK